MLEWVDGISASFDPLKTGTRRCQIIQDLSTQRYNHRTRTSSGITMTMFTVDNYGPGDGLFGPSKSNPDCGHL
jgi:hypothetical protein